MKIRELLSDESRWTQRTDARDDRGAPCNPSSRYARRWCLLGAISKCYDGDLFIYNRIENHLGVDCHGKSIFVSKFNDTHTYVDIKALVDELDI
jgi:hypothetical protein